MTAKNGFLRHFRKVSNPRPGLLGLTSLADCVHFIQIHYMKIFRTVLELYERIGLSYFPAIFQSGRMLEHRASSVGIIEFVIRANNIGVDISDLVRSSRKLNQAFIIKNQLAFV